MSNKQKLIKSKLKMNQNKMKNNNNIENIVRITIVIMIMEVIRNNIIITNIVKKIMINHIEEINTIIKTDHNVKFGNKKQIKFKIKINQNNNNKKKMMNM